MTELDEITTMLRSSKCVRPKFYEGEGSTVVDEYLGEWAADLIDSQRAEIERLRNEIWELGEIIDGDADD